MSDLTVIMPTDPAFTIEFTMATPGPRGLTGLTREFTTSTSAPTSVDGTDGDIWFQYRLPPA